MPTSRAVLVLGMHRSGTSAMARGLASLGVDLGNDFLDAQPENPTGYWEDKNLVAIDDRVLESLGLKWDSVPRVDLEAFDRRGVWNLQREAASYCRRTFTLQPLWGFKDPRVIRILPFWRAVLHDCDADESYVVVIRNPRSIAASLSARQSMEPDQAYRLWLVHMVPFLGDVVKRRHAVVDYDLLMLEPRATIERVARRLGLPERASSIERFTAEFLDAKLRHSTFSPEDLEQNSDASRLTREAYLLLRDLAEDRLEADSTDFQSAWEPIVNEMPGVLPSAPRRGWFGRRK